MFCPKFNIDLFKNALAEVYDNTEFSFDDFEKILHLIAHKNYTSLDKETGITFLATSTKKCLENAFNEWYEQVQERNFSRCKEFINNNNIEDWHERFVEDLVAHAYTEISLNLIEKYFSKF